jgi:hypothetical protein
MDTPPVAKTDLRPWRSQIDALLVGIPMNPVVRRAVLDAFEEHGLLAYTKLEPEIAVDELGRLRKTRVDKALETSMKTFEVRLSLSSKSCTSSLEICCNLAKEGCWVKKFRDPWKYEWPRIQQRTLARPQQSARQA